MAPRSLLSYAPFIALFGGLTVTALGILIATDLVKVFQPSLFCVAVFWPFKSCLSSSFISNLEQAILGTILIVTGILFTFLFNWFFGGKRSKSFLSGRRR